MTIGATDIYLHLGTVLFAAYALLAGSWQTFVVSMLSITLHEGAHAAVAAFMGHPPGELELTPLGAVMRMEEEERFPTWKRAGVIAAGPLMTLLLCFLALHGTSAGLVPSAFGRQLFAANMAILAVNLLPALPLDGGRLLALLLSCFLRPEQLRTVMRAAGTALGVAVIGGSVWLAWQFGSWNWSLAAVGCFLLYSSALATTTAAMAELRMLMDRKITLEAHGQMPIKWRMIQSDQRVCRAIRLLEPRAVTCFMLTERGSMKQFGWLTEQEMISTYLAQPEVTCGEVWQQMRQNNTKQK